MSTLAPELVHLIATLPKAELHVHLEGSILPADAAALARAAGITLPGLLADAKAEGGYRYEVASFAQFITLYIALSSCLRDEAAVVATIDAVAKSLARQRVRWAEITVTPLTHIARGFAGERFLAALAEGRARARENHGVQIGWVFDVVRCFPDQAEATLDWALQGRAQDVGVIALGIGGPEGPLYPGEPLRATFDRARAHALPAVPHAGEQSGSASVWEAIELFHARRIGHGFRSIEDPELMRVLRDRAICLEVCPSSNLALVGVTSLAEHPLPKLMAAGVHVVLASDDPPLVGTTLTHEYERCAQAYAWDRDTLKNLMRASFVHALLDDDTRQRELANFECAAAKLDGEVSQA